MSEILEYQEYEPGKDTHWDLDVRAQYGERKLTGILFLSEPHEYEGRWVAYRN
jgi:hypothetical protein